MCVYQLPCSLWVIALHYIPFHSMTYIHKHTNATVYVYMILWFWILKIWYNVMVFSLLLFFLFVSWYQIKVIYLAILWYMLNNVDSVCMYIYIYTYGIIMNYSYRIYHPSMYESSPCDAFMEQTEVMVPKDSKRPRRESSSVCSSLALDEMVVENPFGERGKWRF